MKLTKDMFDFERYDYAVNTPKHGDEYFYNGAWWRYDQDSIGILPVAVWRTLKLPPRYILLNEGEPLKPGDELLEQGHTSLKWGPPADHIVSGNVEPGEIWRRKVQE